MKVSYCLSVLVILLSTNILLGQRCGGGVYEVRIYSLNGVKINHLRYEVLGMNLDYLSKINAADNPDKKYCQDCIQVHNLTNQDVYYITDINRIGFSDETIEPDRSLFDNQFEGAVSNGIISFKTRETYHQLYLLKVYDQKNTLYLIDNFMGGCNNQLNILWSKPPKVVYN